VSVGDVVQLVVQHVRVVEFGHYAAKTEDQESYTHNNKINEMLVSR
jgi:hypothetical protein